MTLCSLIPRSLLFLSSAGLVLAVGGLSEKASAQDRSDRVTDSAAEIQGSESYGQPYERDQAQGQGYTQGYRGQGSFQDQDYGRPYTQSRSQDGYQREDQQRMQDFDSQRQRQSMQRGPQDEQPGGLGVVLREAGERGVQVTNVYRGSPADQAGLRPGDQIVEVDGQQVQSVRQLQSRIAQQDPGQRIEIVALRNGREQSLNARLEARREALSSGGQQQQWAGSQGRQQFGQYQDPQQFQGSQQYQSGQRGQSQQVQARLASLERQLQQLLREVQNIQDSAGGQSRMTDAPQAPRQAQRPDSQFRQQQQWDDQQWNNQQQWEDQQRRQGQSDATYNQDRNRGDQDDDRDFNRDF